MCVCVCVRLCFCAHAERFRGRSLRPEGQLHVSYSVPFVASWRDDDTPAEGVGFVMLLCVCMTAVV